MPYQPGNVTERYGPQLLFRGRYPGPSKSHWRVRIVVGWDPEKHSPAAEPVLEFPAKGGAAPPETTPSGFRRYDATIDGDVAYTLWANEVDVVIREREVRVSYTVKFAGHEETNVFVVPGIDQDAQMGYCSCNDVQDPSKRGNPTLYRAWTNLVDTHDRQWPYHLMVAGGDQIYGDEVIDRDPPITLQNHLESFYLDQYLRRFADEPQMAAAMKRVPMLMQADDHDYYNGAGSHDEEPVAFKVAHRFRFMFQLGREPEAAFTQQGTAQHSSGVYWTGPSVMLLTADFRSNRSVHRQPDALCLNSTWEELISSVHTSIKAAGGNAPEHLIVAFAVPLMFLHSDIAHKIVNGLEHDLMTDFRDSPLSPYNIKQTRRMVSDLHELAKVQHMRLTFLSGDAHVWGHATFRSTDLGDADFAHDHRAAMQWISSPICNFPSAALPPIAEINEMFNSHVSHVAAMRMELEAIHDERNYMRIYVDTAQNNALCGVVVRDAAGNGTSWTEEVPMVVPPLAEHPHRPTPGSTEEEGGSKCCVVS